MGPWALPVPYHAAHAAPSRSRSISESLSTVTVDHGPTGSGSEATRRVRCESCHPFQTSPSPFRALTKGSFVIVLE